MINRMAIVACAFVLCASLAGAAVAESSNSGSMSDHHAASGNHMTSGHMSSSGHMTSGHMSSGDPMTGGHMSSGGHMKSESSQKQ